MRQKPKIVPKFRRNPVKNRGFTLVEILIAIAVIGVLAAITAVAYNGIQERGRDAQWLQDIKKIEDALRIYLANKGSLPSHTSSNGNWEQSNEDGPGDFLEKLVDSGVISAVPVDPVNSSSMHYRYQKYNSGTHGCESEKGAFGVLQVIEMEASGRPHPQSPGFSCGGPNWNDQADYTIGIFENE